MLKRVEILSKCIYETIDSELELKTFSSDEEKLASY